MILTQDLRTFSADMSISWTSSVSTLMFVLLNKQKRCASVYILWGGESMFIFLIQGSQAHSSESEIICCLDVSSGSSEVNNSSPHGSRVCFWTSTSLYPVTSCFEFLDPTNSSSPLNRIFVRREKHVKLKTHDQNGDEDVDAQKLQKTKTSSTLIF